MLTFVLCNPMKLTLGLILLVLLRYLFRAIITRHWLVDNVLFPIQVRYASYWNLVCWALFKSFFVTCLVIGLVIYLATLYKTAVILTDIIDSYAVGSTHNMT